MSQIVENFYSLRKQLDSILDDYQCKGSHVQNYLYFTYEPVFNYTEAVIILCNNKKFNAASVLLRSLIEVHIKIIYHQTNNFKKRLAISALQQFIDSKKIINEISKFIKDYPAYKSLDNKELYNEQYLSEALNYQEANIKNIMLNNKLSDEDKKDKNKSLLAKAISNDKVKVTGAKEGHFQNMYTLEYRQLSDAVHLDLIGLSNFFKKNRDGKYFKVDKFDERILISEAIGICVALTKDLYENKVINDVPKIIYAIEGLLTGK